jgi:hypothetical protein
VILEAASKLTRHSWRTQSVTFELADSEQPPNRFGFTPQEAAERHELLEAIRDGVEHTLTARQRHVFTAIVLGGVPLDVPTAELNTTHNAIYKSLFDARRKLRRHLVAIRHEEFERAADPTSGASCKPAAGTRAEPGRLNRPLVDPAAEPARYDRGRLGHLAALASTRCSRLRVWRPISTMTRAQAKE